MKFLEWIALILSAFLIFAPLIGGVVQNGVQAGGNNGSGNYNTDHTEQIQGWLTFFVAAFSLIVLSFQAWIYHGQRELMRRQNDIMEGQLKATEIAANTARDTLIYTQSAALFIESWEQLKTFSAVDAKNYIGWTLSPKLTNTGATRAENLSAYGGAHIFKGKIPTGFIFPEPPPGLSSPHSLSLGAQQSVRIGDFRISKEDVEAILSGSVECYIAGGVTYSDVFQVSHVTTYCVQALIVRDPMGEGPYPFDLIGYGQGNQAH